LHFSGESLTWPIHRHPSGREITQVGTKGLHRCKLLKIWLPGLQPDSEADKKSITAGIKQAPKADG